MSGGWSTRNAIVSPSVAIAGVVTNRVVSVEYPVTAGGALHKVIKLAASGVTVVGGITAKLQTAISNDWVDSKTVSITADGNFYIKLNVEVAGDQTYLPLLNKARVVITTTNAGDQVTLSAVDVLQEE